METRRPQLSQNELHQLRWLLGGALCLLAAWTVVFMGVGAMVPLAFACVAVPVAMLRPSWVARLPTWAHRMAFPLLVAIFVVDLTQNREPFASMIRLTLMLLIYRGVTLRRKREDLQLVLLSLFLIVSAGVLTTSFVFALQILAFTACALAFLLVMTLAGDEAGGARPAQPPAWTHVEWRALARRVRAVADWRVLGLGSLLFAAVVAFSAAIFLVIPRFELNTGFFSSALISKKSRTGFSDSVRLGDVVDIQQDNSLALSVDVSDRSALPAVPYWRMVVLDEYKDGGFRMSARLKRELRPPQEKSNVYRGGLTPSDEGATATLYLESGVSSYLPLPGDFSSISFSEPLALARTWRLQIAQLPFVPFKMLPYRIEDFEARSSLSDPRFARRLAARRSLVEAADDEPGETAAGGEDEESHFLGLSVSAGDLARLQGWIAEIGPPEAGDANGFVRRAASWLAQRHPYSLQVPRIDGQGDVIVRWMASDAPGHCELFAGSLVLLCRAAGLPARMVTGFMGGTWNETTGSILVRNSNAHAWCEVFDEEAEAWQRADPTPGGPDAEENLAAAGRTLAMPIERGWDTGLNSLRIFWYRRIVNFDRQTQADLVNLTKDALMDTVKGVLTGVDGRVRGWVAWLSRPWGADRWGWGLGGAAAIAVLAWCVHRLWLRLRFRPGRRGDPVRNEAGRWLVKLSRGFATDGGELRPLQEDLRRLRYGPRESWASPVAVFRAARRTWRRLRRKRG